MEAMDRGELPAMNYLADIALVMVFACLVRALIHFIVAALDKSKSR